MAVAAGGFVAAVGIEYRNGTATGNRPSASDFGLADAIVATVAGALGVAYVAVEVGAGRILAAMGGGRQRSNAWR